MEGLVQLSISPLKVDFNHELFAYASPTMLRSEIGRRTNGNKSMKSEKSNKRIKSETYLYHFDNFNNKRRSGIRCASNSVGFQMKMRA